MPSTREAFIRGRVKKFLEMCSPEASPLLQQHRRILPPYPTRVLVYVQYSAKEAHVFSLLVVFPGGAYNDITWDVANRRWICKNTPVYDATEYLLRRLNTLKSK